MVRTIHDKNAAGQLKELHRGKLSTQVSVILIPGTGTLPPSDWSDAIFRNGLHTPSIPPSAAVWAFDHTLNAPRTLNRSRIEKEGGRLLDLVQDLQRKRRTAIVLISHSLGGIVLKYALRLAHELGQFSALGINRIVLFSCPNFTSEAITGRSSLLSIAKEYAKFDLSPAGADVLLPGLTDDVKLFLEAVKDTPVCSVYEEKPTNVREGRPSVVRQYAVFAHAREKTLTSLQIVDKDTATLGDSSLLLGAPAEHNSTCRVRPRTALWSALQDFLEPPLRGKHDVSAGSSHSRQRLSLGRQPRTATVNFSDSSSTSAAFIARTSVSDTGKIHRPAAMNETRSFEPNLLLPCHYVPYGKNEIFHGRTTELNTMSEYIFDPAHADTFRSFAVTGNGGMGKSQIVNEFVHAHKDKFPVTLWVPADDREKMEQAYSNIAVKLGFLQEGSVQSRDNVYARQLVLEWLAKPLQQTSQTDAQSPTAVNWLIVFDNVDSPDLLADFWPHAKNGVVILTSRDTIANSQFYAIKQGLSLKPFGVEESTELLLEYTGQRDLPRDDKQVKAVVDILGGLPLAVYQMAGVIARQRMGFDEFVEQYRDEKQRRSLMDAPQIGLHSHEYKDTLASVWRFEKLESSRGLLDILAFLDPDGIPEFLLTDLGNTKTDVVILPPNCDYHEARLQLLSMSLITRNIEKRSLVIHRLVQEAARTTMSDVEYSARLTSALELMHAVWPREKDPAFRNERESWKKSEILFTHLILLGRLAGEAKWRPPVEGTMERMGAVDVLLDAAWFGLMRSNFDQSEKLLRVADTILKTFLENTDDLSPVVEMRLGDLAITFEHHSGVLALHTNRPSDSLRHLRKHVTMLEDRSAHRPTENDSQWGVAHNELGNAYLQNNNAVIAEECFRTSIDVLNDLESTNTNTLTMPQINLGFSLWLQGRLDEAADEFAEVLRQRKLAYGENDAVSFALGKLYLGYGNVMLSKNNVETSMKLHEQCVARYKDTLGPLHHRTADGSVRLADHYIRERRFTKAQKLLDDATLVYKENESFLPERSRVAYKQWKLAVARADSNAEALAQKAVEYFRKMRGEQRSIGEFKDEDFDREIMFWSR